jgi:hypothetical protein
VFHVITDKDFAEQNEGRHIKRQTMRKILIKKSDRITKYFKNIDITIPTLDFFIGTENTVQ